MSWMCEGHWRDERAGGKERRLEMAVRPLDHAQAPWVGRRVGVHLRAECSAEPQESRVSTLTLLLGVRPRPLRPTPGPVAPRVETVEQLPSAGEQILRGPGQDQ